MRKTILRLLFLGIFIAAAAAAYLYFRVVSPVMVEGEAVELRIPTGSSYDDVKDLLKAAGILEDEATFTLLAKRMNYVRDPMRPGRYVLPSGATMVEVIRLLRNGPQTPVNVVLASEREPINVAAKVAQYLEPDSTALAQLFQDQQYLDSIGYSQETLMSLFIPNTYEFFWNTSPRGFIDRMLREHDKFWNQNNRREKAEALGYSPAEIYTLASIIEKETLRADEKKRMAGVYHNRLQQGMLLQADPTAVFATREFNTTRVLNRHIQFDSPYNTYMYPGLPPGPIFMSSISSIDAALAPEQHEYIFFCARGDGSGYHNFAETIGGHGRNKQIYVENLKRRGLR